MPMMEDADKFLQNRSMGNARGNGRLAYYASGSTFLEFPDGFLLAFNKLYRCPSGKAL